MAITMAIGSVILIPIGYCYTKKILRFVCFRFTEPVLMLTFSVKERSDKYHRRLPTLNSKDKRKCALH